MSILSRLFDERFLAHRQRSTSIAGIVTAVASVVLFEYRFYVSRIVSWDLLGVAVTFVAIKIGLMIWYSARD